MGRSGRVVVGLIVLLVCTLLPHRAWALLQPGELALVINENVPESRRLAEYYAKMRDIPDGRIIALRLPATDELSFEQYERDVFRPVRQFLLAHGLQDKVKCLVTFYGVPLRVGARQVTRQQQHEINQLRDLTIQVRPQIDTLIEKLESVAQSLNAAFTPTRRPDIQGLALRAQQALGIISGKLPALEDARRQEVYQQVLEVLEGLGGPAAVLQEEARALRNPNLPEPQKQAIEEQLQRLSSLHLRLLELQSNRYDPAAREQNRELVRQSFGLLAYAQLIEGQLSYFKPDESVAAVDSELALLWWPYYLRANWIPNPLFYEFAGQPHLPVVMVARLDAPQAGQVHQLLLATRKAEQEGLRGRVAIDARGIAPVNEEGKPDGYGQYDQTLRNLAEIVQKKTKLPLTYDDKPEVYAPGTVKNVAIYAGWYSVQNYVPAFTFVPGAVGYHIASFELTTLRDPEKNLWVKGLLEDGIVATLGPVAEPYTVAFPRPDLFFPLLFTGKLTLAEVYWRTQPTASWRVALIGDPLYRPFAVNPALSVEDLPEALRRVIPAESPTSGPSDAQAPAPDGR